MSKNRRGQGRDRRRTASVAALLLALVGAVLLAVGVLAQDPAPSSPEGRTAAEGPAPEGAGTSPLPASRRTAGAYKEPVGPVMDPSVPTRLRIPSLRIATSFVRLGLAADGTMEVPQGRAAPGAAGWFTGGSTPGDLGPAVVAGHVTWDREPAVFFEVATMRPGQRVEIDRRDGSTAVFAVTAVKRYAKTDFPTDLVYGRVDHAALRLITCGGVFDGEDNRYLDNVVVYAKLIKAVRA